jgi:hypothetical protein
MALRSGWRNFWWLNVAMLGAAFIGLFFFSLATMWHRVHPKELIVQHKTTSSSEEKVSAVGLDGVATEKETVNAVQEGIFNDLSETATAERDPYLGRGYPSKKQFGLFTPCKDWIKALAWGFWIPWRLFAAFVLSWSVGSFLTINLTQSQNFADPPYSRTIGFMNFALPVGSLISLATNGRLSDWIAARTTKRNRGIREPEMRLPTLIPYVCIMLLGNFIVAFGYQHKRDWKVS